MTDLRQALQASLGPAYTLERELDGGGMSRVFVATDNALARPIVVKVLPVDAGAAVSVERFQREVKLAARLQHPHIVPLLSTGETADGTPFYTMPFVNGETLRARIQRSGELSIAEAVRLLRDIASALAYAHGEGVVHRDIKPGNVILSGGVAVVTDFGVAKAVDAASTQDRAQPHGGLTSLGVALGTPEYMSPEQASADPHVDHRADIYSFGCLAYEVLAGTSPFANRPPQQMLAAHVGETPEPIVKRRRNLPTPLADLVMRCLEKRPADRWQSAEDLLHQLDAIATPSGRSEPTSSSRAWSRPISRVRMRRLAVGAGVALVILGLVGWRMLRGDRAAIDGSVAVLTFNTIGADTGAAYLAEGLADGITTSLSGITRLNVISRTAVRRLADPTRLTSASLGKTLGTRHLVGGSIQRVGTRLLVTVELVRAETGKQLWTARYDTTTADVLAVQSLVAEAVASAVAGRLLPAERTRVARRPTENPAAYDHYLRGNRLLWNEGPTAVLGAIAEYEAALSLDSTFSGALGRLACAYALAANWSYPVGRLPADSVLARGLASANRAIQADSANSDAWLGKGFVLSLRGTTPDLVSAVDPFKRAVRLDPSSDAAHGWYAVTLRRLGRFAEAEEEYHRALALNPNRVQLPSDLGFIAFSQRSYAVAIAWYKRALQIDSTLMTTHHTLSIVLLGAGDAAGALREGRTALRLASETERPRALSSLAAAEASAGDRASAEAHFDEALRALGASRSVLPQTFRVRDAYELALGAVALRQRELAINILDRTRPRGPWLWTYLIFVGFDPIRDDPRFRRIIDESRPPGATDPR